MLRHRLLAVPLVAAAAAALAMRIAPGTRSWVVVAVVAVAMSATAVALARSERRSLDRAAVRLERAAGSFHGHGAPADLERVVTAVEASTRRRQQAATEERRRVERLLDDLPPAILLFGDGGLAYANQAARAMFALTDQTAGSPLQVLGVPALAQAVAEAVDADREIELEVTRGDRWLHARASVTAPGEVAVVVTDVTAPRRIEAIRRDFVTNASHELKTPVAGMQALADSLATAVDRDPARARRMVGLLQRESTRLGQLVRDLLDLSRLEEPATEQSRRPLDVVEIVSAEIERLTPLAVARGVTVMWSAPAPLVVVGVPEDVRLIVANLLDNAVQYNRDDGLIEVAADSTAGGVMLTVRDTGIGIADAERERIFERFYRVDKARSRAAGGTGLGLAIVRHAVSRLGGTVTVDSVLGEGSVFRVVLPVEGSPT